MSLDMSSLKKRIQVAKGKTAADLVVKNGRILNVFTGNIVNSDIAIVDGVIAGIGCFEGNETIDAHDKIIVPGFIDGHMHIESTMLTPSELSKVVLQHGVTALVADPHEIANVAGTKGIEFMLKSSEQLPVDIFIMLPSCVPATSFEHSGAVLEAEQLLPFYKNSRVLGLAEVMNFSAIKNEDEKMLRKITDALSNNRIIDGHAAGLNKEELNIYALTGARADHECVNVQEANERLELGMYLMIREGTSAKELTTLLPVITQRNSRRCLFVTDDKLLDDLIKDGSVDYNVRLAIKNGLDVVTAIQMVTINTAECFKISNLGAIAPGYQADFLILDDLESVSIDKVFKKGKCVIDQGLVAAEAFPKESDGCSQTKDLPVINMKDISSKDFEIPLTSDLCNIIEVIPNSLITNHRVDKVEVNNNLFCPSVLNDQLKIAVIERHHATGNVGLGIVKGFGIKNGAIATSVANDSHNIVVMGTSDEEMLLAVNHLKNINGGVTVVYGNKVLASLPLTIGGLMSEYNYMKVHNQLVELKKSLGEIGFTSNFNPFLTLSFLALPVIPELKITDIGLFKFKTFSNIPVQA